jgi:divalent metal cation (Fe/Co/Zn/Cd) transporter
MTDSSSEALLVVGARLARRGPDPEHPFGHGPPRYFTAFRSLSCFVLPRRTVLAVRGLRQAAPPPGLETPTIAPAILAVPTLFEGMSRRPAVKVESAASTQKLVVVGPHPRSSPS